MHIVGKAIHQLIYHLIVIHINLTHDSKPIHYVHVNVIMANMQTTLPTLVQYWLVFFDYLAWGEENSIHLVLISNHVTELDKYSAGGEGMEYER